jgi:hypothetical protein
VSKDLGFEDISCPSFEIGININNIAALSAFLTNRSLCFAVSSSTLVKISSFLQYLLVKEVVSAQQNCRSDKGGKESRNGYTVELC